MSRLGYITQKLQKADEAGEQPELSEADLRWAAQWERWDLVELAGYDVEAVKAEYGADSAEVDSDPYRTAGVPRVGADREMRIRDGRVETVDPDDDDPDDDPEDYEPYEAWKVDDLRAELKGRGLPVDGKKEDLVARLEEHDEKSNPAGNA